MYILKKKEKKLILRTFLLLKLKITALTAGKIYLLRLRKDGTLSAFFATNGNWFQIREIIFVYEP